MSAASAPVLRALPRRPRAPPLRPAPPPPEPVRPVVGLGQIAARSARWALAGLALLVGMAQDHLAGRRSVRHRARRLRALFEQVGGTAIKLGQQLAIRRDVLPEEVCAELSLLMDRVPPMPWERAQAAISATLGRPWPEVFAHIEPRALGSASIATVYRGALHDGAEVAIKVQREEVSGQFAADLRAFELFASLAEALGLVRPEFFKGMRFELRGMFLEELDLRLEARYTRLFRRQARRTVRWVVVPRVYTAHSGARVLVTELIRGRPVTELMAAAEQQDAAALARFAAEGITPRGLARHVMTLSAWSRFEAAFFHADPHPANLMVLPGGRLGVLDFGACGVTARRSALYQLEFLKRLVDKDVAGVTATSLANLSPIPYLEVAQFQRITEPLIGRFVRALEDPEAHWSERTTAALWLTVVEYSRQFQIPMNMDTLRMIRSTLLYDSLAFRLDPDLDLGVTRDYLRDAARRHARRVAQRAVQVDPRVHALATLEEGLPRAELALDRAGAYAAAAQRELERGLSLLGLLGLWAVRLSRLATAGVLLGLLGWGVVWLGPPLPLERWAGQAQALLLALLPDRAALPTALVLGLGLGGLGARLIGSLARGRRRVGLRRFRQRTLR